MSAYDSLYTKGWDTETRDLGSLPGHRHRLWRVAVGAARLEMPLHGALCERKKGIVFSQSRRAAEGRIGQLTKTGQKNLASRRSRERKNYKTLAFLQTTSRITTQ